MRYLTSLPVIIVFLTTPLSFVLAHEDSGDRMIDHWGNGGSFDMILIGLILLIGIIVLLKALMKDKK